MICVSPLKHNLATKFTSSLSEIFIPLTPPVCCVGQGLYERLTIFPFTRICMSFQFGGTELDSDADTNYKDKVFRHFKVM